MNDHTENPPLAVIVLAAGKGTRMRSDLPKVLHPLAGKAMLCHVLDTVAGLQPECVGVVVAPDSGKVRQAALMAYASCQIVEQPQDKHGTAAATLAAQDMLEGFNGDVLVLFGDTPLITCNTLDAMRATLRQNGTTAVTVLGMRPADPAEYGRLVLNSRNELEEIVEFKDASPVQREIALCNSGVMAIRGEYALNLLHRVQNRNAKGEYYLTDIIALARSDGHSCAVIEAPETEVLGVNSREQLAHAEAEMQNRLRRRAMENGVTMLMPETVFLSYDTELAADVTIHPYVYFGENVSVESGVEIRSFSHLEGATVGSGAIIGPYARLRPGAIIGESAHIGNFVEIKKTTLEEGVKVNHLSYIGDAYVGAHSNIGAGTITCNYDGFEKHPTRIGKRAFVGSNTSLIAPVSVGDGAIVGAGSVIAEDVEADSLALTRPSQHHKKDWARQFRQSKKRQKVN